MTNEQREIIALKDRINVLLMIIEQFIKVLPEEVLVLPSTRMLKIQLLNIRDQMQRERAEKPV